MSWLLNFIEPEISEGLYSLKKAKVWDTLHELVTDLDNVARIYGLKQLIAVQWQDEKKQ